MFLVHGPWTMDHGLCDKYNTSFYFGRRIFDFGFSRGKFT